jgi:hypothetical protein
LISVLPDGYRAPVREMMEKAYESVAAERKSGGIARDAAGVSG